MIVTKYFRKFFQNSQSSGILLIVCVITSLLIANSSISENFQNLLNQNLIIYPIKTWINDGLMAIFFLLVGLEIKRELLEGELSSIKSASLPIIAAIGGMILPALIFIFFNSGTQYKNGWGIPMATDIAFSLAIISLIGKKIPASLKIFLAALAIVDDLGAILVIAIFYTDQIHWDYLAYSLIILAILVFLNFLNFKKHIFYLIPGIFLWFFMHHSGIHATIAGVLLAFTIPTNKSNTNVSPLEKLEEKLHFPVSYIIMPIFALANTNITFHSGMVDSLFTHFGLGIIFGLIFGKILGINVFSYIAIKLKISKLPSKSSWFQMIGVGLLAGIGFTMSIFIALLSFKGNTSIQDEAKFAILIASALAGFSGYFLLKTVSSKKVTPSDYRENF